MTERLDAIQMTAGELVAGRYRLAAPIRSEPAHALWQADDDILGRQVAVRLVCGDERRLTDLLASATRAGSLVHDSVAAVYDTGLTDGCVYIVREWVPGESVRDLLDAGPLDAQVAAELGVQLAEALAAVTDGGLRHRRLHLGNVIVTPNGGVKITDVGTADVLDARHAPEARWLGGVLYGALTARWPYLVLPVATDLPEAVYGDDDRICSPSQLRAGVPSALDGVTVRALTEPRYASEVTGPDLIALAEPLRRLPRARAFADEGEFPAAPEEPGPRAHRRRRAWWGLGLVIAAAMAALIVVALAVAGPGGGFAPFIGDGGKTRSAAPSATTTAPSAPGGETAMTIVAAHDYDPFGNDGSEDPKGAALAINGNPADGWRTDGYFDPLALIGKKGVGLVVDLGRAVTPKEFSVTFAAPGTSWEVRTAPSLTPDFAATVAVGTGTGTGATTTAPVAAGTSSRYWVVWLTALPRAGDGRYRSEVREISVR